MGFAFGFFLLHPISMVIFRFLDPMNAAGTPYHSSPPFWRPIFYSFHADMLPMGFVFGSVGCMIALVGAYHRRTILKQNEKLEQLERANRRQTQFLVHDIKNSLARIIGFANYLLKKNVFDGNSEYQASLARIQRQACQMQNIVNDLLDFAKLQNIGALEKEPVDIADLILESARDFSLPDGVNAISIGEKNTSCPPAWGNKAMLRRILVNLLSNAVKHNPPGTAIQIDADCDPPQNEILFSCCDEGVGIPQESIPTLFDEFTSEKRLAGSDSTGLGLAFCKAAVEAHGGRIWCKSGDNQGARFYFTIPSWKENHHE